MHLNETEQRMRDGEHGDACELAMTILVELGEQIAWGESNAVAFVNSVIGARTERYADLTDVCAAITGRVPALGLHLDENRKAERLISLEGLPENAFNDARIFALLGFVFGEMAGDRVSALAGMPTPVSMDHLKSFSAAAASSGAVGLFHILGVTPEAPDVQTCFKNGKPLQSAVITPWMIDAAASRLNQGACAVPDLITFGCPHYSVDEFKTLEKLLDSRRIKHGIECWVFTSRNTYAAIKASMLLEKIERCGVKVFTDGCALQYPGENWDFNCAMSDSVKYANYCFSQTGLNVIFSGTRDCVETAVSGERRNAPLWK